MIAISLHVPWAFAMATLMENGLPVKSIETRDWSITYRGPMAIHAAKKPFITRNAEPVFLYWVRKFHLLSGITYGTGLGCVVCIVHIIDCVKVQDIRDQLVMPELIFGNYDNKDGQRYAWVTDPKKLKILKTPAPATGHQKFWNWKPPSNLEFK